MTDYISPTDQANFKANTLNIEAYVNNAADDPNAGQEDGTTTTHTGRVLKVLARMQVEAEAWATQLGTKVYGEDWSAKEQALGTASRGISGGGSSRDWANYTGGTVDDVEYSAKYYRNQAETYATAAAGSLSELAPSHVISETATPPGSPAAGDSYIIAGSATGVWSGHDKDVTRYDGTDWVFFSPSAGQVIQDQNLGHQKSYTTAGGWQEKSADFITFKTGSQVRTLGERLGDYPDVRDEGYKTTNTRAQNKAALDAYIAANQYLALPPETLTYTGTLSLGTSQHMKGFGGTKLDNNDTTAATISIDGSDVVLSDVQLMGHGDQGQLLLGPNAVSGSPITNIKLHGIFINGPANGVYGIMVHRVAGLKATDLHFKSTGYGVLQMQGKPCSDLNFSGVIGENMFADLFEFNGVGATGYCDGLSITDVDYRGANAWTTPATERRVMGFTAVKNALITNVRYRNCAGDAAFHFEDVGGDFVVSNTHGYDCNVANGNTSVFLLINSEKSIQISNSSYKKTRADLGATTFLGMSGGSGYGNPINVSNVMLYNEADYSGGGTPLSGFDFRYHTGPAKIEGVMLFGGGDYFADLLSAANKEFVNCSCYDTTYGFQALANIGPAANCGSNIKLVGGVYNYREYAVVARLNTNGTGNPTNWKFHDTRFEWSGTGGAAGVSVLGQVNCAEIGTTYGAGQTGVAGLASHKSVYEDGAGWVTDV